MSEQTTQSVPVQKILVVDSGGYGFNILTTLDGETWLCAWRRKWMNEHERDLHLERLRRQQPQAEERWITDFYGRIPQDWLTPTTRVI
jgi:hypothetical protein